MRNAKLDPSYASCAALVRRLVRARAGLLPPALESPKRAGTARLSPGCNSVALDRLGSVNPPERMHRLVVAFFLLRGGRQRQRVVYVSPYPGRHLHVLLSVVESEPRRTPAQREHRMIPTRRTRVKGTKKAEIPQDLGPVGVSRA
jgi:hypothetical protein